eukprot:TRINITY_DN230_c1_g1_i1.p1 TRINITY_DN230_c1_g1~~TRINITY_DN230_c1_g1_i1.p1  ORF type:complete len:535 (+),score=100.32 TRINITY_DN230_c1_g1_i1:315-1919(+)
MLGKPRLGFKNPPQGAMEQPALVSALHRRIRELEEELRIEKQKNERKNDVKENTLWPWDELRNSSPSPNARKQPKQPRSPTDVRGSTFKLASQVLVLKGKDTFGQQTSLKRVLAESKGRDDRRGDDTPILQPASHKTLWKAECAEHSSDDEQQLPHCPGSIGRANLTLQSSCLSPNTSDRIMSTKSRTVLETSPLAGSQIPIISQQVMAYLESAYCRDTNTFSHSDAFPSLVTRLCEESEKVLQQEPLYARVATPCYVFGDVHGNYADLSYFLSSLISFRNLSYSSGNILFLGDYVDRGEYGLECVALLLSLKLSAPERVFLLRGNHEDPLVNGDIRHYGNTSFLQQCTELFGVKTGNVIWKHVNSTVFKNLPLSADIDRKIFCTHGGIPRFTGGTDTRLADLQDPDFPRLESFSTFKDEKGSSKPWVRMTCDLCWSDPKDRETGMDDFGFADNNRGGGTICFGKAAVDDFLSSTGFEYVVRAHQEKSDGLRLSKSAKVITLFSSSDYEGHRNGAGLLFINTVKEIRMIIKKAS